MLPGLLLIVDQVLVLHPHTLSLGWTIQESEVEPKLAKLPSELIGQWTTYILYNTVYIKSMMSISVNETEFLWQEAAP